MKMTVVPACLTAKKDALVVLDQTRLPTEELFLELKTPETIFEAIKTLKVRGAPAIGIAAAFGLYVCTLSVNTQEVASFLLEFQRIKTYLASSRPTAVNLFWALNRMEARLTREIALGADVCVLKEALLEESEAILAEDQKTGLSIGRYGLSLLKPHMGLLTHCNAGGIATSGYGTALAPMYLGQEEGFNFKVYADETRPLLQGSRLTAYELGRAGIDVTVICDNMAAMVMKEGKIDAVLVGCDRVAANGDTANKIGTLGLAILAKEFQIPFYILGPTSTIDRKTPTGNEIEIELRDSREIGYGFGKQTVPEGFKGYNPAFDVTDAKYITAIITEKGILGPPYEESIKTVMERGEK